MFRAPLKNGSLRLRYGTATARERRGMAGVEVAMERHSVRMAAGQTTAGGNGARLGGTAACDGTQ